MNVEDKVRARQDEAIQRVAGFLQRHNERGIAESDFVAGVDEHRLRASDLTMLLNAVLDSRAIPVQSYEDGHNDGKMYITRDQAGTLAEAMSTYFPAFENPDTTITMSLIRRSLEKFAKGQ